MILTTGAHKSPMVARWAAFLAMILIALAAALPAKANTIVFGSYTLKTYWTDWGTYPYTACGAPGCGSPYIYEYCAGGLWGETAGGQNNYKEADMWTDEHFISWNYAGDSYDWSYIAAYTHQYNGLCTRGATDHYGGYTALATTSDGF